MEFHVAIIGGGPAGSTVGALIKKYNPSLDVVILEKENFPRDHVGESHLPAISDILVEMGAWDKVEAANFPVKIGGTYRWGNTTNLWDLEFLRGEAYEDPPRPAKYQGQRARTAFQVDRSVYDQILLDHAESLGCKVMQQTKVTGLQKEADTVYGLQIGSTAGTELEDDWIEADFYVDCSGEGGVLRKAFKVESQYPTKLRNIAIWDYWQDADWAVSIGTSGTRIQIMSLGWGWLWFIPITETRTSVGLVVPADYYKQSGESIEALYRRAIAEEPLVSELTKSAMQEGKVQACKDWSFVADRLTGENWFLAGDSCGFADPILSAGMTLAHTGARRVAYTILELYRNKHPETWLKKEYEQLQKAQIGLHIKFADYWYTANACFTDLKAYCSEIADSCGLQLDPDSAFRWLATGGFTTDSLDEPGAATFPVSNIKIASQFLSGQAVNWQIAKVNHLTPNLTGAKYDTLAHYDEGKIEKYPCYRRNGKVWPMKGGYKAVFDALSRHSDAQQVLHASLDGVVAQGIPFDPDSTPLWIAEILEALITEGWIEGSVVEGGTAIDVSTPAESETSHWNRDQVHAPR